MSVLLVLLALLVLVELVLGLSVLLSACDNVLVVRLLAMPNRRAAVALLLCVFLLLSAVVVVVSSTCWPRGGFAEASQ